ncbi:flagellar basal body P-ring formation chaperone FlgA [Rubrivirga sp.]|uniref:flagellar basal body P-ring formation chaperone FlgA n=1 Tax=Rubrivirga sp. TaxID=1885344 RepID=UPI003C788537
MIRTLTLALLIAVSGAAQSSGPIAMEVARSEAPPRVTADLEVEVAARAAIEDVWADAEVEVVRLSRAAASASPVRVRFRDTAPRGRVSAEVETPIDGVWQSVGWAFLEVSVFETVWVASRALEAGDTVSDAVELARAEVTGLYAEPLAIDDLEGWTATVDLEAGAVVTSASARPPVAVADGEPVRVLYGRGAVRVELTCQARETGSVGEVVRVVCSDPYALYRVRVTAPGAGTWAVTL